MQVLQAFSLYLLVVVFSLSSFSPNAFGGEEAKGSALDIEKGKRIYSISCVLCHGSKGKGDGPASVFIGPYSHPRPNDFTRGVFKYRSTESGDLPTFSDLTRTIRYGIPGYMPSFKHLTEDGIRQVALYISDTFIEDELSSQPMDSLNAPAPPKPKPGSEESARVELYKGIAIILNNIAKNSLTAVKEEKNPERTLNMYKQIIAALNGMVSHLGTPPQ